MRAIPVLLIWLISGLFFFVTQRAQAPAQARPAACTRQVEARPLDVRMGAVARDGLDTRRRPGAPRGTL